MKKNLLFMIISMFSAFTVIMGTGFFFLWNKVSPPDPQVELKEKKNDVDDKNETRPLYALDTFIVNLSDRSGGRYLRTTIVLELTNEEAVPELKKRLPQIRDVILTIIPAKRSTDIQAVAGKEALGDEIMSSLNYILKNGSVTDVFFTDFVMQ